MLESLQTQARFEFEGVLGCFIIQGSTGTISWRKINRHAMGFSPSLISILNKIQ